MTAPAPDAQADANQAAPDPHRAASSGRIRTLWNAMVAGIAVMMGILPHVLHHIGLLAGTALIAGAGGTVLFGLIGLAASVPFLLKLYRRFGTWLAPAVALLVFSLMFAVSAFVIDRRSAAPTAPHPRPLPHPPRPRRPGRQSTTRDTTQRDDHGSEIRPLHCWTSGQPGDFEEPITRGGFTSTRPLRWFAGSRSTDGPGRRPLASSSNLHSGSGRGFTHRQHPQK